MFILIYSFFLFQSISPDNHDRVIRFYDNEPELNQHQINYLFNLVVQPYLDDPQYIIIEGHGNESTDSLLIEKRMKSIYKHMIEYGCDSNKIFFQYCGSLRQDVPVRQTENDDVLAWGFTNDRITFQESAYPPNSKHLILTE